MQISEPAFRTDRLNVFRMDIRPSEFHQLRAVFLGFLDRDDVVPHPAVTATVWVHGPYTGHTLEMITTVVDHQREGLATEMVMGIEQYLQGKLHIDATAREGKWLIAAVERAQGRARQSSKGLNTPLRQQEIKAAYFAQRRREECQS